jgi:hypothetical protein
VAVILHRASGHPERKHEFIWRLKRENTGPDLILDLHLVLDLPTWRRDLRRDAGSRPTWRRDLQRGAGSRPTWRRVEANVAGSWWDVSSVQRDPAAGNVTQREAKRLKNTRALVKFRRNFLPVFHPPESLPSRPRQGRGRDRRPGGRPRNVLLYTYCLLYTLLFMH